MCEPAPHDLFTGNSTDFTLQPHTRLVAAKPEVIYSTILSNNPHHVYTSQSEIDPTHTPLHWNPSIVPQLPATLRSPRQSASLLYVLTSLISQPIASNVTPPPHLHRVRSVRTQSICIIDKLKRNNTDADEELLGPISLPNLHIYGGV